MAPFILQSRGSQYDWHFTVYAATIVPFFIIMQFQQSGYVVVLIFLHKKMQIFTLL